MDNNYAGRGFWISPALEWLEHNIAKERARQDEDVYNSHLKETVQNNLLSWAILRADLIELQEQYQNDRAKELKKQLQ